jgi:hypothetical protein
MNWSQFELIQDLSDSQTEIVKHTELGLYLKVLPEARKRSRYAADEMVFVATLYRRSLSGKKLADHFDTVHLQVMNLNSGKRILWDADLLANAVRYYCTEHLDRRLDRLSVHHNGQLMPFEDDHSFQE